MLLFLSFINNTFCSWRSGLSTKFQFAQLYIAHFCFKTRLNLRITHNGIHKLWKKANFKKNKKQKHKNRRRSCLGTVPRAELAGLRAGAVAGELTSQPPRTRSAQNLPQLEPLNDKGQGKLPHTTARHKGKQIYSPARLFTGSKYTNWGKGSPKLLQKQ